MGKNRTPEQELWSQGHLLPNAVEAMGYTPWDYIHEFAPEPVRIFVISYAGSAMKAAQDAGYGLGADTDTACNAAAAAAGFAILRMPLVRAALKSRGENELAMLGIAKREELQAFWTDVMFDETKTTKERISASDKLARSFGMHIEKKEIKGEMQMTLDDALLNLRDRGAPDE